MDLDPTKIRMIGDKVLVRCDKNHLDTISTGGIVLPATVGNLEQTVGIVLAVGPGKWHLSGPWKGKFVKTYLKPGDRVLFSLEGSAPIDISDKQYAYAILLSEHYVLGTL